MLFPRLALVAVLSLGARTTVLAEDSPQFEELFGDEAKAVATTASKQDDIDFASKLLSAVERLKDDPTLQGILCQKAYEAASRDPSGYGLAVMALDRFASIYPERKDYCDQTALYLLERQYKSARPTERRLRVEPYLQRLTSMADRKIDAGDLNAALAYLRVAASLAGTGPKAASLTAKVTSVVELQEVKKRISELRAKHEAEPKNESVLRALIEYITVETGDAKELSELVPAIEDQEYRRLIEDISRPTEDLTEEQARKIAEWWTAHVDSTTSSGRMRATQQATASWKRFLSLHAKQDAARLKAELSLKRLGTVIAFAAPRSEAPAKPAVPVEPVRGAGKDDEAPTEDALQIYNTHNWTYGDRGTRICNVKLKLGTQTVWKLDAVSVAWNESKKVNPKTTVDLPAIKYDTVRIEVVEWVGASGGLAEIELIRNGKNVALHRPATASDVYNPEHREHCTPQMINDGIVDEARDGGDGKGYWLLPTGKPGWIEILVGPRGTVVDQD